MSFDIIISRLFVLKIASLADPIIGGVDLLYPLSSSLSGNPSSTVSSTSCTFFQSLSNFSSIHISKCFPIAFFQFSCDIKFFSLSIFQIHALKPILPASFNDLLKNLAFPFSEIYFPPCFDSFLKSTPFSKVRTFK